MNDEGLYTTIWGGSMWESLHNITFNYPFNPTETDKHNYRVFFMSLSNVLPCCTCRNSYKHHIISDSTKLTDDVFNSRDTLTKWLYDLHTHVNHELDYEYNITYKMLCDKHNSYIAKSEMTSEQKQMAFINMYNRDAPYIHYKYASAFANYAKSKELFDFSEKIKYYDNIDKQSKEWYARNEYCNEHIKNMRINNIKSIDEHGLPTVTELILIMHLCTTLTKCHIQHIITKLGFRTIKYKIITNSVQ